jgi:hypothetical protein
VNPALVAQAILGKDAEEFLNTDIGRYLVGCAEQEIADATDKLFKVSPWRRRRIAELQSQVWRAQSFQTWLAEIITTGRQAIDTLEQKDE